MGTHAKGPSVISSSQQPLSDWLTKHPDAVGDKVTQIYPQTGQLPFLFKVLSVNKSLSIQAHPDKVITSVCVFLSLSLALCMSLYLSLSVSVSVCVCFCLFVHSTE